MARLGRYQLRDRLGRGGFATVYRAWDPMLRREVALKALSLDLADEPEMRRRFLAEAQALASLKHPHIVAVYDVGETVARPFFAMELIEGQTLDTWLAVQGRLELPEAVAIVGELADALDTLHAAGLVHRDVKAPNVMLAQERGRQRVVLMDLGIARHLAGPRFTATDLLLLSADTAAPEQIQNQPLGPATDIYALGVVTYQMLAGRPPFLGDTAALLYAHVHAPPAPLWELRPGLPGPVYAVLDEALAKDPVRRPASAGAFAAAMHEAAKIPETLPLPAVLGLDASAQAASQSTAADESSGTSESQPAAGPAVVQQDGTDSRQSTPPIIAWWTQPAVLVMALCALLILVGAFLPWSGWRVERVSGGQYGPVPGVRAVGLQYTVAAGLLLNHELSEPRNFTLVAPDPADLPEVFNAVRLGTGLLTLVAALGAFVALVRRAWLGYALAAFLGVWVLSAGDAVVKVSASQHAGTAVFGDLNAAWGLYLTAGAALVGVITALMQTVQRQSTRVRPRIVIALTGAALLVPLVEALIYYQVTIA